MFWKMEVSAIVGKKVRIHVCLILCGYRGRAVCVLCAIARIKKKKKSTRFSRKSCKMHRG
jgi:hypothetical protein